VIELSRGKGNKLINVPTPAYKSRDEFVIAVQVLGPGDELLVMAGQRHLRMKDKDLEHYLGERARRGENMLMLGAMDAFKRLFSNDVPPLAALRSAGLTAADRLAPVKRLFMRQALGLGQDLPPLARP